MLMAIDNLREIARCCHNGEPLEQDTAMWLGNSIEDFLDRKCATIEEALGLIFPRGGIPWWREEANRRRDAALRKLARRFYADHSISAKSKAIHTASCRYAASSWRFDKNRNQVPDTYVGTPKEYLWDAFDSGATMPISERHLRSILD